MPQFYAELIRTWQKEVRYETATFIVRIIRNTLAKIV